MTGRDDGPNLQRRNTETGAETEAETEAEAETDIDERNGNTDTEDQVLVQGETSYFYKKIERGVGKR
jgi:hypothetical protein